MPNQNCSKKKLEDDPTFTSLRYPSATQGKIWLQRRQNIPPSKIADQLEVSRPFVSKAQRIAESRIGTLLEHAASINRVQIRHISTSYGIAIGYSAPYDSDAYILYSPSIGVQIWFDHEGQCETCSQLVECKQTLLKLAEEWEISIDAEDLPNDMALHLFETIMRRLKWQIK
ncbi:MAG: hypothetical protein ACFE8O_03400 [Candidatus Hermodarchaeota archaeon]